MSFNEETIERPNNQIQKTGAETNFYAEISARF